MDIKSLLDAAKRLANIPEIAQAGIALARELKALTDKIIANHDRAQDVLTGADLAEIEAIHFETLALIDAFDAELARAAAR